MAKRKARNEFRYNYNTKHMTYVFEEDKKKFHSIGITHDDTTWDNKKKKRRHNLSLVKNPQRNHTESSFIRFGIVTDKQINYSKKPAHNFIFSKTDFRNVKSKIRNYKNRRRK